jgi:hypothetical protein
VTRERSGCAETITYSAPVFERETTSDGVWETAFVDIAILCRPACGRQGLLSLARRPGKRDWQIDDFSLRPGR